MTFKLKQGLNIGLTTGGMANIIDDNGKIDFVYLKNFPAYALNASPALSGTPTAPTVPAGTYGDNIATTKFTYDVFPTKVGAGASGTWNINISGLAANATNSVYADRSYWTIVRDGDGGGGPAIPAPNRAAVQNPTDYRNSVSYEFKTSGALGISDGNYSAVMTVAPWASSVVSGGDASYQLVFSPNAPNGISKPNLRVRAGIDTTWGAYYKIVLMDSSNNVEIPGDGRVMVGPNLTWGAKLAIGGSGRNGLDIGIPSISTTNGNVHIDPNELGATYLSFYNGKRGTKFGDGNSNVVAAINELGDLSVRSVSSSYNPRIVYYSGFTLDANNVVPNTTGFTYGVNAPYSGPLVSLGGDANGHYALQFNATYGTNGYALAYRTNNGDGDGVWNPWYRIMPLKQRFEWLNSDVVQAVAGEIAWRNYGNNHTIFDASAGLSPTGAAINNTYPMESWSGSYPTLMGYNGTTTYGVRVDIAGRAETAATGSPLRTELDGLRTTLPSSSNNANPYTLAGGDAGTRVRRTVNNATTRIPPDSEVNFAINTVIHVAFEGDGTASIDGSAVTLLGPTTFPTWRMVTLMKNAANNWSVYGGM